MVVSKMKTKTFMLRKITIVKVGKRTLVAKKLNASSKCVWRYTYKRGKVGLHTSLLVNPATEQKLKHDETPQLY